MNITLEMEEDDEKILKENTVDFISFSYYASRLTSADPQINAQTEGNVLATLKNPYQKPLFIVENGLDAVDTPNANGVELMGYTP